MAPFFKYVCLRFDRPASLVSAVLLCLLVTLCNTSSAQNVQGLPAVGNGSGQSSSQMLIDATQFSGADICAKINAACAQLGTTGYPAGAAIDARGFTGNQVCLATNITKMLNQCSPQGSSHGATGGKLLLGEVNLYADGPSGGVIGNYSDSHNSGVGTPADHSEHVLGH